MANKLVITVALLLAFMGKSSAFDKLSPELRSKISPALQSKVLQSHAKAQGIAQDANHQSNKKLLGDIELAKQKAEGANNISPDSLDSEGMRIRNEAYKDKNFDLHQASKLWNAEKRKQYPADDPIFNSFDSVTKNIKSIFGKDCNEVKSKHSPGYIVKKIETKLQEDILEKNTCEHLKNSFSCINDLSIRCSKLTEKEAQIKNLKLTVNPSIPLHYDINTGIISIGTDYWTHKVGLDGRTREARIFDYRVEFDIDRVDSIYSFKAMRINYDDFILVKLNGHKIYSGPFGGDVLELLSEPYWMGFFLVERKVTTGIGTYSPEQNTWWRNELNLELKSYLNTGRNIIDIRLVVAGRGGLYLNFRTKAKQCNQWSTEWREVCVQD